MAYGEAADPYATPIRHAKNQKARLGRGPSFMADLEADINGELQRNFKPRPPGSSKPDGSVRHPPGYERKQLEDKLGDYLQEKTRIDAERHLQRIGGAKVEANRGSPARSPRAKSCDHSHEDLQATAAAKKPVRATGMEPHSARQGKRASNAHRLPINLASTRSTREIEAESSALHPVVVPEEEVTDDPPLVRRSGGRLAPTTSAHRVLLDVAVEEDAAVVAEHEDEHGVAALPTLLLGYRSPQRALCRIGLLSLQKLEANGSVRKAVTAYNSLKKGTLAEAAGGHRPNPGRDIKMTAREKAEVLSSLLKVLFGMVGHNPEFEDFDYLVEEGGLAMVLEHVSKNDEFCVKTRNCLSKTRNSAGGRRDELWLGEAVQDCSEGFGGKFAFKS